MKLFLKIVASRIIAFLKTHAMVSLRLMIVGCMVLCGGCSTNVKHEKTQKELWESLQHVIVKMPHTDGDLLVFSIPAKSLFNPDSANFTASGRKLLNDVAAFISNYETEDVHIVSYLSREKGNITIMRSLAREQAHRISLYLWNKNLDMHIIYDDGYAQRIPSYGCPELQLENRMEIRMQVFSNK